MLGDLYGFSRVNNAGPIEATVYFLLVNVPKAVFPREQRGPH